MIIIKTERLPLFFFRGGGGGGLFFIWKGPWAPFYEILEATLNFLLIQNQLSVSATSILQ